MYNQREQRGGGHARRTGNRQHDTYDLQSHTPHPPVLTTSFGHHVATAQNYTSGISPHALSYCSGSQRVGNPPNYSSAHYPLIGQSGTSTPEPSGPISLYSQSAVQQQVKNHHPVLLIRNRRNEPTGVLQTHEAHSDSVQLPNGDHIAHSFSQQQNNSYVESPAAPQNHYGPFPVAQSTVATRAHPANMSYPYNNNNSQYNYAPGSANPYAQQGQQSYDQAAPSIRNPFPAPPPAHSAYSAQNAGYDPEQEALMAQWQSQYAPADAQASKDSRGKPENANTTPVAPRPGAAVAPDVKTGDPDKKVTVVRKGGGQTWEDNSLLEWDPTHFRIMVGNLAGEVTDDSLTKAFAPYGVSKARVIRDKRTTKSKGFGFVSFFDGEQGFKAAREMVGKYIGSHPVTIQRSKTDLKPVVQKDKYKGKGKNNKNNRNDKKEKKQDDPLRAHTGAVIEKKPVKNPGGYKVIG